MQLLGAYLESLSHSIPPEQLPYLRGWYYERDAPWLAEDLWQQGDFHRLPKRHHPDFHWLFLGAAGAKTPLHVDPSTTHAWLTQLSGRKRFTLFPPQELQRLRSDQKFRCLEEILRDKEVKPLEVILEPGDTIFVPMHWAHEVVCLEDSVSLTWNFLGRQAFPFIRAAFLANSVPRSLAPRGATTTGAKTSKERPERPTRDDRGAVSGTEEADGFAAPALAAALGASACAAARRQTTAQRVVDEFEDVCEQTGVTLSRYCIELANRGIIDEDLSSIFNSIREAAKVISKLVNTAPLKQAELLGLQGEINVQGEDQKKLDVITNDVFKNALRYTGKMGTLASEEEDEPVDGARLWEGPDGESSEVIPVLSEEFADTGKYICVFDPLDGSSNVDAGIPVGTIFGVFQEPDPAECELPDDLSKGLSEDQQRCLAGTLQPGKSLVAAGYVLYSASTELVLTFGQGVVGFTLDSSIGEFVMTRPSIKIPARGKIYSCNQGNINEWDQPMRDYIEAIRKGEGESKKPYSLRYIGSMVGDIHRTLLYGGIFAYPADKKNQDGKLRLLYEGAPMSFIMEQAGGKAITGHSRVLDIPPVGVHQRVPVILGSAEDVDEQGPETAPESG
ncbi:6-bisphosphatase [Durusdinium trenchii]|uniref:fructose-bisphosphatase n=1 Tax=Durusdinium trenchii TaxID=1381693 RepID=A0ABP0K1S5_9DINO